MFLIIYCSLDSTFAYQQWFSACPFLTLPARHNLISFLPVLYSLYFNCPSFLRFAACPSLYFTSPSLSDFLPSCPSLYFTSPSLSDFLPSCPSLTLLARPLASPARAFHSNLLILRLLSRRLLLPLAVGVVRIAVPRRIVARHLLDLPCKRNCNPVLGASLRIGLRFVWRESFSS
jgi:hypothetical protein